MCKVYAGKDFSQSFLEFMILPMKDVVLHIIPLFVLNRKIINWNTHSWHNCIMCHHITGAVKGVKK